MYDAIPALRDWRAELDAFTGYCVAYFAHEVLVGTWEGGGAVFCHAPAWRKAQEVHIFNGEREYRAILASDGRFRVRVRADGDGCDAFDECVLIIGNRNGSGEKAGFFAAEESGRAIVLPAALKGKGIVIRNYLDFEEPDAAQMPGCVMMRAADWRFAGFRDEEAAQDV